MKYIYLNKKLYTDFSKELYPELEIKKERPSVQIVIEINKIFLSLIINFLYIRHFIYESTYAENIHKYTYHYLKIY